MNRKGFTLIELSVALLLSGIVALMAMGILHTAWRRSIENRERSGLVANSMPLRALVHKLGLDSMPKRSCFAIQDSIAKAFPDIDSLDVKCKDISGHQLVEWQARLRKGTSAVCLHGAVW
jgi:prepilin-type N-terminal cleavage/methylation domain-containing protein